MENGFFDPDPARLYAKAYSVSVNFDVLHEQSPSYVSEQVIDEEINFAPATAAAVDSSAPSTAEEEATEGEVLNV